MIGTFGGTTLAYDDVGTGIPVVLLHGFPHDRSLWESQLGALTPARTLACDLRGFGGSSGTATTIDDYARDTAAFIRGLDIESAVVIGLSMGGYAAMALWRLEPSLIRALVLCDTRSGPDDDAARAKRDEHIALVKERGAEALADLLVQAQLGKTTRAQLPELAEHVHAMLARAPSRAIIGALAALRDRPDSAATLGTIDVPTLIVVGDEDVITPAKESRAMHAAIPGSRLEIIAGAGHLSNVERPASFNHVVGEFLASLSYS